MTSFCLSFTLFTVDSAVFIQCIHCDNLKLIYIPEYVEDLVYALSYIYIKLLLIYRPTTKSTSIYS